MDKQIKLQLRKDAQTRLVANPQDPLHGVTHHYRTWLIAQKLVEEENLLDQLDLDLLELVCWWHDVLVIEERLEEGERVVNGTARYVKNKFPLDVCQDAADAVETHEFGTTPKNLLGSVLQDADKLEILSQERINDAVEAVKAGIWTKEHGLNLLKSIKNDWLPKMLERYNFEFSRKYHQDSLEVFLKILDEAGKTLEG